MGLITRIKNAKELKKVPESKIALVARDPIEPIEENGDLIYRLKDDPHLFIGQLNFIETRNFGYSLSSKEYGYLLKTPKGIRFLVSGEKGNFENYNHTGGLIVLQDFPRIWRERILVGESVYSALEKMGIPSQNIRKLKEMTEQ